MDDMTAHKAKVAALSPDTGSDSKPGSLPADVAAPVYALWLAVDALDAATLQRNHPALTTGVRAGVAALQGILGDVEEAAMCQGLDQLACLVGAMPRP